MAKKLRWGILGVAKINDLMLPAFAKADNAEVTAIASRSLDKAKAAAKSAGIAKAYGSYQELIDDPDIDCVYNPLPNDLHAEWTKKAAERGKHILCEKPLTPTAAEAQDLVDFCRARKVCLMDGFMWPHHPRTAEVRKLLDAGTIGPVRRVTAAFTFRMPTLDTSKFRLIPQHGGGSLLDVGCYCVYGIRWALQEEPVKVYAVARHENDVDVEVNAILWFPSGRMASFDCAFVHPYRMWLEVVGTTGSVLLKDMWVPTSQAAYEVRGDENNRTVKTHIVEGQDQIQHMIENFGRFVLEGKPVTPSPEEAVKTLRVLDALARSAREGREIAV